MNLYECLDGDYEGSSLSGALHHCDLTGHTLTFQRKNGTTLTIAKDTGEDT